MEGWFIFVVEGEDQRLIMERSSVKGEKHETESKSISG